MMEEKASRGGADPRARQQQPRILRVGTRTYRKVSRRTRRAVRYTKPEITLSNNWLRAAGFYPGDIAFVSSPCDRVLLITVHPNRFELLGRAIAEAAECALGAKPDTGRT